MNNHIPPGARFLRAVYQVLVALVVAVPVVTAALGFTAATAAKVAAVMGATVAVVAALQNGLEKAGIIPTLTAAPAKDPEPLPVVVANAPDEAVPTIETPPAADAAPDRFPSPTARKVALGSEKRTRPLKATKTTKAAKKR